MDNTPLTGDVADMDQHEYLEMLLDELPEEREGVERRKHSLTRGDLRIIAALIDKRMEGHPCRIAMSPESAIVLTEWVDTLLQVKKWSVRGAVLVIACVLWGIINLFNNHHMWPKGWWEK